MPRRRRRARGLSHGVSWAHGEASARRAREGGGRAGGRRQPPPPLRFSGPLICCRGPWPGWSRPVRKRACVRGGGKGRPGGTGVLVGPVSVGPSLSRGCAGGVGVVAGCGEGRDSHWEEPGSRLGVQRYVTFENYCNQDHIHPSYMQSYHVIAPWRHGMKTQFRCRIPEPPRGARSKHGEQQKLALRLILMQVL